MFIVSFASSLVWIAIAISNLQFAICNNEIPLPFIIIVHKNVHEERRKRKEGERTSTWTRTSIRHWERLRRQQQEKIKDSKWKMRKINNIMCNNFDPKFFRLLLRLLGCSTMKTIKRWNNEQSSASTTWTNVCSIVSFQFSNIKLKNQEIIKNKLNV